MTMGPESLLDRIRAATADEYTIDREIGRGGMAAVFLGRDLALDRRVAIKVMLPDLINVQGVQDRFVIEARTAAHLDHPGIVTVYAVKQRGGLLFIAMKYIEGYTLEAVLRSQGQIDPAAAALIGSRVAEALSFAHGEGVVHRDVKPSNIMIDMRGRPVVTDFGIARVMTAQSITVAGSMLGTPTHMSPEQCRGLPASAASDQYSLGVTMYEMLSGRVPFTGSLFELIDAHREQTPPPLSEFVRGVDPELEHTVMRMLAKNAQERWGSLTDVVQRLSTHTFQHRGDDNLRATLVLSGGFGSSLPTPERGIAAIDLLTPPGGPLTPSTPISVSGSTAVDVNAAPQPGARSRWLMAVAAAAVIVVIATLVVRAASSGAGAVAPPAVRTDSAPAAAPAAAAAIAAAARDSVARDSVARAAKDSASRDSTARVAGVKDSMAKDSVAKALVAKTLAARDSAAKAAKSEAATTPKTRPESITVSCARLLERVSLGEKLTDEERSLLRQRCPK
jgi:serine/threonine-protein kinase